MQIERISIENVGPVIDDGKYPIKRVVDEKVQVTADIFSHGTERINAQIAYRIKGSAKWKTSPLNLVVNDSWSGEFAVSTTGNYEFKIQAWLDRFSLWFDNLSQWIGAGEEINSDLMDGILLISKMCHPSGKSDKEKLAEILSKLEHASNKEVIKLLTNAKVRTFLRENWDKEALVESERSYEVTVDPGIASFSSWYELFPRSQTKDPAKSGTFADVEARLPDISEMGFNVLYLTPIHPIGTTNRRGKNGARKAGPGDPGSPWAIGNREGGHKSVNPDLGKISDFERLVANSRKRGIEVAMDIAFQCSPDHPYVREHPEWFFRRSDGSIRYAENPPKRYYDVYPINFDTENWNELWNELKSVFEFWIEKGVRIFRVDNPHTKPFQFWKWLIAEIKGKTPDVIFFAEAFTRPKVMYELSKLGFSQSYSYFTWKNYHYEIIDYFTEVNGYPVREHFRPVLFTNTPDILTENLQLNGKNAFMYRAFLAATLSPSWGIYSGYELCENRAVSNTEEYLNSEKYEIKVRNWFALGNIRPYIAMLNAVRSELKPLQFYRNLRFLQSNNPNIVAYERSDRKTTVIIAVCLNPTETHSATISLPSDLPGIKETGNNTYYEYMTDTKLTFYGLSISVSLKPGSVPGMIFVRS